MSDLVQLLGATQSALAEGAEIPVNYMLFCAAATSWGLRSLLLTTPTWKRYLEVQCALEAII